MTLIVQITFPSQKKRDTSVHIVKIFICSKTLFIYFFKSKDIFFLKSSSLKLIYVFEYFFFCKQWSNYIESTLLQCALLQTNLKYIDIFSLRLYCFLLLLFWGLFLCCCCCCCCCFLSDRLMKMTTLCQPSLDKWHER